MPEPPASRRIVEDIRAQIESGRLKPGDRLPTMEQMREQYSCSDTPIKTALAVLEGMGLITRRQGVGIYVR